MVASRRGRLHGPVDEALVALVNDSFMSTEQDVRIQCFALPVRTGAITVWQMWHPRMDVDPAHR